jgi:hypothetical protein
MGHGQGHRNHHWLHQGSEHLVRKSRLIRGKTRDAALRGRFRPLAKTRIQPRSPYKQNSSKKKHHKEPRQVAGDAEWPNRAHLANIRGRRGRQRGCGVHSHQGQCGSTRQRHALQALRRHLPRVCHQQGLGQSDRHTSQPLMGGLGCGTRHCSGCSHAALWEHRRGHNASSEHDGATSPRGQVAIGCDTQIPATQLHTHAQGQLNDTAQEQTQRQHAGDSTHQWHPRHP